MTISYNVLYRVHGTTTWTTFGNTALTTVTVTGLNPNTSYDFEVQAVNEVGTATSNIVQGSTLGGVTFTSITLSSQTFTAGSNVGTPVGTISVGLSSGTFNGAFQPITGPDAAFFQIVSGVLQLAVNNTTARSYNISITVNQSGVTNTPFTQAFPNIVASVGSLEASEGALIQTIGPTMNASRTKYVAQSTGPWNVFALINTGTGRDPQISLDTGSGPQVLPQSGLVAKLAYHNHVEWQFNGTDWYWWDTASSATPDKFTLWTINSVNLSGNNTYTPNLAANQPVATVSVVQSDGQTFQGTYSVVSTPGNAFKMVGAVLTSNIQLSASSYSVTVTATPNVVGNAVPATFSLTNGTNIQPLLGVHLGNGLSGFDSNGANPYSSIAAHYPAFNTAMNRTCNVIAAVGGSDFAFNSGDPTSWGSGDAGNWVSNSLPTDGNTYPQLTWTFAGNSADNSFSLYTPSGSPSLPRTVYGGQTIDHWITTALDNWRSIAAFKRIYIRINWEFNQGGPVPPSTHFEVPDTGTVATWISAWKGFCNSAHNWGNANGVNVRMCWCPTTPNGIADSTMTFGRNVSDFFPFADANAINGRYIDVVAPDVYAISTAFGFTGGATIWCFDNYVKIAQTANCNVGIMELGDFLSGETAWQNWIPHDFTPYLNNLKNLSPAVPIEVLTLFDLNVSPTSAFSNLNPAGSNDCNAWRTAIGSGSAILTIPPN
jgi:hypothetical protein